MRDRAAEGGITLDQLVGMKRVMIPGQFGEISDVLGGDFPPRAGP
jgi:hypothetical protein